MLALDANIWVAAFDPADVFHAESVRILRVAAERGLPLAGPAYVMLESVCALGRRVDPDAARTAGERMIEHPALHLEPLTEEFLSEAQRLGIEHRLRAADALYAATAARLDCLLLSWDSELINRAGALSPRDWLAEDPES
jgi:predicted nucleic acid-binding protein